MGRTSALALAIAVTCTALAAEPTHLEQGAAHFRAGRYDEALVELKVAALLNEGKEAQWYVAAVLQKLARTEEALDAFGKAEATAPDAEDALLDYYRALACYDAQLLHCADRLLEKVEKEAGPKVAGQARQLRARLKPVLSEPPPHDAIDVLIARATAAKHGGRDHAAVAFAREARELSKASKEQYRSKDIEALEGAAR
jgi:tetratricopeptide (TPR) repeat protein